MGAVTDALVERVDELLHRHGEQPLVWGNPLVSTTPTSMAIHDLCLRVESLEEAVREIALAVQRLSDNA